MPESIPVFAEELAILDRRAVLGRVLRSIIRVNRVDGRINGVVLMLLSSVGGVDLCVCLVVGMVTFSVE